MSFIDNLKTLPTVTPVETFEYTSCDMDLWDIEFMEHVGELYSVYNQLSMLSNFKNTIVEYGYTRSISLFIKATGLNETLTSQYGIILDDDESEANQRYAIQGCESLISDLSNKALTILKELFAKLKEFSTKITFKIFEKTKVIETARDQMSVAVIKSKRNVILKVSDNKTPESFWSSMYDFFKMVDNLSEILSIDSTNPYLNPSNDSESEWSMEALKKEGDNLVATRSVVKALVNETSTFCNKLLESANKADTTDKDELSAIVSQAKTASSKIAKALNEILIEYMKVSNLYISICQDMIKLASVSSEKKPETKKG